MSDERILIIEDELAMRQVLCDCLARHGYRVISAVDGDSGLSRVCDEKPDLILLDVMMPKLDGFALCQEIRRLGHQMPILFLSAKASVSDRVKGLDSGGDDYLPKPFSREELLARVRALLRRKQNDLDSFDSVEIGEATIDFVRQCASRNGRAIPLSRKEIGILKLLTERKEPLFAVKNFSILCGAMRRFQQLEPWTVISLACDRNLRPFQKHLDSF